VPSRIWYGTSCLLVRDATGSVSCSDVWGMVSVGLDTGIIRDTLLKIRIGDVRCFRLWNCGGE
jgi:hypothetical protein